jgi:hypothetical protein
MYIKNKNKCLEIQEDEWDWLGNDYVSNVFIG